MHGLVTDPLMTHAPINDTASWYTHCNEHVFIVGNIGCSRIKSSFCNRLLNIWYWSVYL